MSPGDCVATIRLTPNFLDSLKVKVYPTLVPQKGHMGIIPSDIGIDPVINLQTGNLKISELHLKGKKYIYKNKIIF